MLRTLPKLFASASLEAPFVSSVRLSHSEVKIPVPWGHIAGKWWNRDGNTPIIALHGWQDNANSFDGLIGLMPPKMPVLAVDLPGHGFSSHFPQGFSYHRMTAVVALRRIVEHFGWKRVCLMGHSLGGQTCFLYAAIYPEEVDGLVTLDILAPIPMNAKNYIKSGGKTVDSFLKRDLQKQESAPSYTYQQLVEMVVKSHVAPVDEGAAKTLIERGIVKVDEGKFRFSRDQRVKGFATAGWSANEILEFCFGVKTNVLCIKAESSPYFSTKEFFDDCWSNVKKVAKSSDLVYMPGNHHIHLEHPDIVAPVVNNFFTAHYVK